MSYKLAWQTHGHPQVEVPVLCAYRMDPQRWYFVVLEWRDGWFHRSPHYETSTPECWAYISPPEA